MHESFDHGYHHDKKNNPIVFNIYIYRYKYIYILGKRNISFTNPIFVKAVLVPRFPSHPPHLIRGVVVRLVVRSIAQTYALREPQHTPGAKNPWSTPCSPQRKRIPKHKLLVKGLGYVRKFLDIHKARTSQWQETIHTAVHSHISRP